MNHKEKRHKTIIRLAFILFLLLLSTITTAQVSPPTIQSVQPASASPSDTVTVSITLQGQLPPAEVMPESVSIGTIQGTGITWDGSAVDADFTIPANETAGTKDVSVQFPAPPDQENPIVIKGIGAFEVLSGSSSETGSLKVTLSPQDAIDAGAQWRVDSGAWQNSGTTVSDLTVGSHTISFSALVGWSKPSDKSVTITSNQTTSATGIYTEQAMVSLTYPIVDTGQINCYSDSSQITCPTSGQSYYGQDAQYQRYQFSYKDNGDGTVSDLVTGLMWQQTTDRDGDGDIDANDKVSYTEAQSYCENLTLAGYTDWRLPHIKQLYSLIDFRGIDCSAYSGNDTSGLTPFIDNTIFDYNWGDAAAGERLIDSQYASDTVYVDETANQGGTLFGVNFADGRIKGYGMSTLDGDKTFYCMCVRGNTDYGQNNFMDNGDSTITDNATGLMWAQDDSGSDMNWEEVLDWIGQKNAANYLGYSDWRMPNIKELQSIVDYTRSPGTTNSAAIAPLFNATSITNEGGQTDYPYYWSSTTHVQYPDRGGSASYVSFGRALGYMNNQWIDIHGAGAQRSDPKSGDPNDYPEGHGPQNDAIRIYNYVRLVRDAEVVSNETGSLTVTLSPQDAIAAGAQWQVNGGSWQSSGSTVSDLSAGTHTVSFKSIDGWTAPKSRDVSIIAGETATITETYVKTCIAGDIDGNNIVNISDAIITLQILAGLNPANDIQLCSDVNNDGKIGAEESIYMLQKIAGFR